MLYRTAAVVAVWVAIVEGVVEMFWWTQKVEVHSGLALRFYKLDTLYMCSEHGDINSDNGQDTLYNSDRPPPWQEIVLPPAYVLAHRELLNLYSNRWRINRSRANILDSD